MNASPPYSQFDSKGRCVNHPAVQMRCKKLGGGWKTLTSICAMCAMESLRLSDDESRDGPRRPPSTTSSSSSYNRDDDALVDMRKRRDHRRGDDRSVDRSVNDQQSVLSAPAAYHRTSPPSPSMGSHHHHRQSHHHRMQHRRKRSVQQDQVAMAPPRQHHQAPSQIVDHRPPPMTYKKQPSYDSSSSSCDLTADMYDPDVNSYASSRSGSRSGRSTRGGDGNNRPLEPTTTEEEEGHYVCGMAYDHGTYYTGQIDVITKLPHGLGTLRRGGGVLLEGEWQQGALVAPVAGSSSGGGHRTVPSSREDEDDIDDDDERYCLPTTDDEQEEDDDASSISSTPTEWTSASSSPRSAAYSARESKPSILPYQSHPPTMAINGTRATFDRLRDYEEYVDKCDEEGDWYHEPGCVRVHHQDDVYDRVRRVRFLGDP